MSSYPVSNLGTDWNLQEMLTRANMPDKLGPFKTTDVIGVSAVAAAGLLTFIIVKRARRKRRRR
jgi:hypothetical protein